jgi:hypothetical protein
VLLLLDKRELALLAMIACLVALLWSFAIVCLDDAFCRDEDNYDELSNEKHHQRATTAAPLVACIVV